MNQNYKTELLIGNNGVSKLKNANIIIFGIGGVGGYTCEMLVRAGIGNLTIVDFDKVDITNINRQIIALNSNVGEFKVNAMQKRILDINSAINLKIVNTRVCAENVKELLAYKYDYVIDAIDSVTDKINLIVTAKELGLNIISAMGAGNRIQIPQFEVCDLYKTYNDGLAKVLRKKLKEKGINKHLVVFSKNQATPCGDQIGSISYYPAMCGCVLAGYVINELLNK